MGRPCRAEGPAVYAVKVRLTAEERQKLNDIASRERCTLSDLLRRSLHDRPATEVATSTE